MYSLENSNIIYNKPIKFWNYGLILGSGMVGCNIWGKPKKIRFALDRGDLWDNTPSKDFDEKCFNFQYMLDCIKSGNKVEIDRVFDAIYGSATPTKLPAGALNCSLNGRKMNSKLDITRAEATIDTAINSVRSFLSAVNHIGFIEIKGKHNLSIDRPQFGDINDKKASSSAGMTDKKSLKDLFYEPARWGQDGNIEWFIQPMPENCEYGIFLGKKTEGEITTYVYKVASSNDSTNWEKDAIESIKNALEKGYDTMFAPHFEWWKEYWNRSKITIPNKEINKVFYMASYMLGAASRKNMPPMPLQGVWTADNGNLPPWKGDYHNDLNTQLNYASYLKANQLEAGESFIDFLWDLKDEGVKFAKDFYNVDGCILPSVMTIKGKPLGGWPQYSLSSTNQLWLAQSFERYYRYTDNMQFLKDKAYPFIAQSTIGVVNLMEERDGKLYLPISSSPEIHDDRLSAWITPNSNYDLALLRYCCGILIDYSNKLNNGESQKWQNILDKLPQLSINDKNILMLCPTESLQESHRHHSHCMSIYPLRTLSYENEQEREIIKATVNNLVSMGDAKWTGYSHCWIASMFAVLRDGNNAEKSLSEFANCYCTPNTFHKNFRGRNLRMPVTLETNIFAMDATLEMLLYNENGKLEFFPAIPSDWRDKDTSFETLRGEGGNLLSAKIVENKVTGTIIVNSDCEYTLLRAEKVVKSNFKYIEQNNSIVFCAKKGSVIEIEYLKK